jgi:hypothetical protein
MRHYWALFRDFVPLAKKWDTKIPRWAATETVSGVLGLERVRGATILRVGSTDDESYAAKHHADSKAQKPRTRK